MGNCGSATYGPRTPSDPLPRVEGPDYFQTPPTVSEPAQRWFSLIENAKANGLEPYAYQRHVIGNIAAADTEAALEALLPWNMKQEHSQQGQCADSLAISINMHGRSLATGGI